MQPWLTSTISGYPGACNVDRRSAGYSREGAENKGWGTRLASCPCGVIVYDLETIHDAERGIHFDRRIFECSSSEQFIWKERSQVIQFAAVDIGTGASISVSCRPEFTWDDVRSPATRLFAEDHGHDMIVRDTSLPTFATRWQEEILPFLAAAAGSSQNLAMIAHNGDQFDHVVLMKEIRRLSLELRFTPLFFDPIQVLKRQHGQSYGNGGQLSLAKLYERHGVDCKLTVGCHQALQDCIALIQVLNGWSELADLLLQEIEDHVLPTAHQAHDVEVMKYRCASVPTPARSTTSSSNPCSLRVDAPEFIPGALWAAPRNESWPPKFQ